ncbi:MAG: hypothetical protein K0Q59_1001 [Paenibacillus sp.]|nr:hypothetical protein [Paenibacillus sp.]
MTHVPLLVIGATFAGIGISSAAKRASREALIVEQASLPGQEFIGSYRPGTNWSGAARTQEGNRFLHQLRQRNVLSEHGRLHIPAVMPIVCDYIRQEQLSVKLMTTITHISEFSDGYNVTMLDVSGVHTVVAKQIVDTTARGLFDAGAERRIVRKSINAMLHHPTPEGALPEPFDGDVSFVRGRFDSELIVQVAVDPDDDWMTARQKLHRVWSERPERLRPWMIAAVADSFETHTGQGPVSIRPDWFGLPSCAYGNLLEAFEAGMRFVNEKGVEHETVPVDQ